MASRALTDVVNAVRCDDRALVRQEQARRVLLAEFDFEHYYALFYRERVENPLDPAAVPPGYATHCARSHGRYSVRVWERIRGLTALDLVERPDWTLALVKLSSVVVKSYRATR